MAPPVMIARRDAAQATLDAYRDRPLAWGRTDCARLVAFNLRQLGYKPGLQRGGSYTTSAGAVRALKRAGFDSLEAALDDLGLARIGHASLLVADIVKLRSEDAVLAALGVALGNGRVLAFSAVHGVCGVAQPLHGDILDAWRAPPWPLR